MRRPIHQSAKIWVFPKIGGFNPPKWMVKIMENPIKIHDLGVPLLVGRDEHVFFLFFFGGFRWMKMKTCLEKLLLKVVKSKDRRTKHP